MSFRFPKRRRSEVKRLDQRVTITETNGVFELAFDITGHDGVPVVIETFSCLSFFSFVS